MRSFEDLRGKKIATGRGSIDHQPVLAALKVDHDRRQARFSRTVDAKVASQGSVDAWSIWERYVSQEEVLFKSRRMISGEGLTPCLSFQVATANAIHDKRPEPDDLLCRPAKARNWAQDHADSYAGAWSRLMNSPVGVPLELAASHEDQDRAVDDTDEQKTIDLFAADSLVNG